jgi:hypothetical protein
MGGSQMDKQGWLRSAPHWRELVGEVRDCRKGGRRPIAIVIPTFRNNDLTDRHLKTLSSQDTQDFDVILVYGQDDGFLGDADNRVHIRRNADCGSAGSFFIGEGFALDNGYDKIILADNDCFPVSVDLVQKLGDAIDDGAEMVFPKIKDGAGKASPIMIVAQYGCISAETLRRIGLSYLPFYFAGEDIELLQRAKGRRIAVVDAVADHRKEFSMFALDPRRVFYYNRGMMVTSILRGGRFKAFEHIFNMLLFSIAMLPFRPDLSVPLLKAISSSADLRLFKDAEAQGYLAIERGKDVRGIETDMLLSEKDKMTLVKPLLCIPRFFGKEIIFKDTVGLGGLLASMTARRSWLRYKGECHKILDNKHFFLFPLFFAMIALAVPIAFTMALALTAFGFAKRRLIGVDTMGYGTKQKSEGGRG